MRLFSATVRTHDAHVASSGSDDPGGNVEKCPAGATDDVGPGEGVAPPPAGGCVASATTGADAPPPPHAARTQTRANAITRMRESTHTSYHAAAHSHAVDREL
jgi:hypothetical protein